MLTPLSQSCFSRPDRALTLPRPSDLRWRFDRALSDFLQQRADDLHAAGLTRAFDLIRRFVLADGKRLRPAFCYWGARSGYADPEPGAEDALIRAAASLELFHSFALIHDDIMDASELRRGEPAMHRSLAYTLSENHADRDRLGVSLAILAGDLLAMWSEQMFTESGVDSDRLVRARAWLARMRNEVMVGQYLDLTVGHGSIAAAERVIMLKTARYTVTRPLQVGGALAGVPDETLREFERFGDPLGTAFQLRDDLLGVFGHPARTGKPAIDDLREGRPTVLIETARRRADARQRTEIDRGYGDPHLREDVAERLRQTITATGAVREIEAMIDQRRAEAMRVLAAMAVAEPARQALARLAAAATVRHK
jgi:geranylgeranyl diphosphate synthase, type I